MGLSIRIHLSKMITTIKVINITSKRFLVPFVCVFGKNTEDDNLPS